MLKTGSKILASFILCLGIVMPTAQGVSHTTQVVVGASGLFAAHAVYEVNVAYKRACKARKKKILAAQQGAKKKKKIQPQQETQDHVAEEKELKLMTWQEFRSTTKYLKKHLSIKKLLASGVLLSVGGYYLNTKKPSSQSTRNFTPGENTVPNTSEGTRQEIPHTTSASPSVSNGSPDSTRSAVSSIAQPVKTSTSQQDHAASTTSTTPIFNEVIKSLSTERPKNLVAQDMVTRFIQGNFHNTELQKEIINLQAGLCRELLQGWITKSDLQLFSKQLHNKSSHYNNILNHLLFLADDTSSRQSIYVCLHNLINEGDNFQSCLFEKRGDDSCILYIHYKDNLYKYIHIETVRVRSFFGFTNVSVPSDEGCVSIFPQKPSEYYTCTDMENFILCVNNNQASISLDSSLYTSLRHEKNQEIVNAAVEILSRAGIAIILPTEAEFSKLPYDIHAWGRMSEYQRKHQLITHHVSLITSALIKELVEERMTLDDIKTFMTLCRENRAYENNIFQDLYYYPPTEEYLTMFRKKIAPGTWDDVAHGTIHSYNYRNRVFNIITDTGFADFFCETEYSNPANSIRFEPHNNKQIS